VLALWRGRPVTAADIKALTRDEAANIYRAQFVRPFDGLPEPVRVNIIDMGVNAGVRRAAMLAQQMIGAGVDGDIGPDSRRLFAARTGDEWNDLFVGFRLAFYERLIEANKSQIRFRKGWRARALSFYKGRALQSTRRTARRTVVGLYGFMGKAA
jgi:lysozyme family protein